MANSNEAWSNWSRDNSIVFTMKIMKKSEEDIVKFLDVEAKKGVARNTAIKKAIREYIANHKEEYNE